MFHRKGEVTMDSLLSGLFGGDDDDQRRTRARDFVGRYETGNPWEGFSGQEAYENYSRVSQQVPDDVYEEAAAEAFGRMPGDQRNEFARMMQQQMGGGMNYSANDPRQLAQAASMYRRQQPGGLAALFGGGQGGSGGGGLGDMFDNPLAKAALGGVAAIAVKKLMDRDGGGRRKVVV